MWRLFSSILHFIYSRCAMMEAASNKIYKSRLFTSNVLLQKDELEEVCRLDHICCVREFHFD